MAVNFLEGDRRYFNFDYGLAPELEAGIAVVNCDSWTYVSFRGKYRLLRDSKSSPSLVLGIQDLGKNHFSPYLTIGKAFGSGVRGYFGVGGGSMEGFFGGVSKTFGSRSNGLELLFEADSHGINLGGKLRFDATARVNFGLIDMDHWLLGLTFTL